MEPKNYPIEKNKISSKLQTSIWGSMFIFEGVPTPELSHMICFPRFQALKTVWKESSMTHRAGSAGRSAALGPAPKPASWRLPGAFRVLRSSCAAGTNHKDWWMEGSGWLWIEMGLFMYVRIGDMTNMTIDIYIYINNIYIYVCVCLICVSCEC